MGRPDPKMNPPRRALNANGTASRISRMFVPIRSGAEEISDAGGAGRRLLGKTTETAYRDSVVRAERCGLGLTSSVVILRTEAAS